VKAVNVRIGLQTSAQTGRAAWFEFDLKGSPHDHHIAGKPGKHSCHQHHRKVDRQGLETIIRHTAKRG
jgi:hypothetical protein